MEEASRFYQWSYSEKESMNIWSLFGELRTRVPCAPGAACPFFDAGTSVGSLVLCVGLCPLLA
eukprot:4941120-Pleurochrysis_carterae.AAC.1